MKCKCKVTKTLDTNKDGDLINRPVVDHSECPLHANAEKMLELLKECMDNAVMTWPTEQGIKALLQEME
jgi:hypothetical protein